VLLVDDTGTPTTDVHLGIISTAKRSTIVLEMPTSHGKQIADVTDGCVGAVVCGLEPAERLAMGVGTVMEAAVASGPQSARDVAITRVIASDDSSPLSLPTTLWR
jgi:hypothetical protein